MSHVSDTPARGLRRAKIAIMHLRWAALAALLIAGGCGGSEPLSRRDYVAEADAVCREAAGRWRHAEPPVPSGAVGPDEFAELAAWEMSLGHDFGNDVLDRVRDLRPAAALEPQAERTWDLLERIVDDLGAYAAALEDGDEAELARLDREVDDSNQEAFQRSARRLGLRACANGLFLSAWRAGASPVEPEDTLPGYGDEPVIVPSPTRSGPGR